jgi:autotransporter-associated beta strand protein
VPNASEAVNGDNGGNATSLTKSGPGLLKLSGQNTFTGGIRVNGGTLAPGASGVFGSNVITLAGGTLAADQGTFDLHTNNVNVTADSTISVNGGLATTTLGTLNIGAQTLTFNASGSGTQSTASFSGLTTVTGNATFNVLANGGLSHSTTSAVFSDMTVGNSVATGTPTTLTLTDAAGTSGGFRFAAVNGVISDNASDPTKTLALNLDRGVSSLGAGEVQVTLSGANTYTGGTTLSSGIILLSGSGTLGSTSGALTLNSGTFNINNIQTGTLDLNGTNQTVGNLTGIATGTGGVIRNNKTATNVTFTIGNGDNGGGHYAGTIVDHTAGTIALTKTGAGTIILSGANTYTGATNITGGKLLVNGSLTTAGALAVAGGATLGGSGSVGAIGGAGTVAPGNSPGILQAVSVDPTTGMDFNFEMTQANLDLVWSTAAASGNDLLRLTDAAAPITAALTAANEVDVNFAINLAEGDVIRGGFFTDENSDFSSLLSNADFVYSFTGGSYARRRPDYPQRHASQQRRLCQWNGEQRLGLDLYGHSGAGTGLARPAGDRRAGPADDASPARAGMRRARQRD